jgi:hypothetical protein
MKVGPAGDRQPEFRGKLPVSLFRLRVMFAVADLE